MLDCPEPTHTSPTSTSAIVIVFVPRIVISAGWSGSHRLQPDFPAAERVGDRRGGLAPERDADGLARIGLAEDSRRHAALQQHVVADDARNSDVREGAGRPGHREKEGHDEGETHHGGSSYARRLFVQPAKGRTPSP